MGFLTDADYENLPEDDHDAFVRLESIARDRLHNAETDQHGNLTYENTLRYMNEVAALAEQFEIPDITYDEECNNHFSEYGRFTRAVEYRAAQIRVRRVRRQRRNSIAITGARRERMQHYLERLKEEVSGSDIPEKRKKQLLGKIADFEGELTKKRLDLAVAMSLIALVTATANDFTDVLNKAPGIISSISQALGVAKLEDDDEAQRLPPPEPFKAIPDFRPAEQQSLFSNGRRGPSPFDSDLDDDVPF